MVLKGFSEFINESESGATYADLKLLLELGIVDDIQDDMYLGFDKGSISYDELLDWVTGICDKYEIDGWTLNSKGLIDVDRRVNLDNKSLTRLPLRFGESSGEFWCDNNQLINLKGCPKRIGKDFYCNNNRLTTLEGAPQEVGGYFWCSQNQLTTLIGGPLMVGDSFYCTYNQLTSLEGSPKVISEDFDCQYNQLTSLKGAPQEVGGSFSCQNNQLTSLEGAPKRVGKDFYCYNNNLINLDGIGEVGRNIYND